MKYNHLNIFKKHTKIWLNIEKVAYTQKLKENQR